MLEKSTFLIEIRNKYVKILALIGDTQIDLINLQNKLFALDEDLVEYYNFSLLEGEYYCKDSKSLLDEIKKKDEKIEKALNDLLKTHSQNVILHEILVGIKKKLDLYTEYCTHFIYLVKHVEERQNKSSKHFLDLSLNYSLRVHENSWDGYVKQKAKYRDELKYWLFLINVKLAEIDEGHFCSKQSLFELIGYSIKLRELLAKQITTYKKDIHTLINSKCQYLILKILRRLKKTNNTVYAIASRDVSFIYDIETLEKIDNLSGYKAFDEISEFHYTKSDSTNTFSNNISRARILKIKEEVATLGTINKVEDLHFFCKFVKRNADRILKGSDVIPQTELKELLSKLISQYQSKRIKSENEDKFNLFAYETGLYLTTNAAFKIEVSKALLGFTDISTAVSEVTRIKELFIVHKSDYHENETPNIQLHRYYFDFVLEASKKLSLVIDKSTASIDLSQVNTALENFFSNYYSENIEFVEIVNRAKDKNLLPIYVSIEECRKDGSEVIVNINEEDQKHKLQLFLDSAYILPSNYDYLISYSELELMRVKNEDAAIFHKLWNSEFKKQDEFNDIKIKEATKNMDDIFEKKVKESQSTAIQLIGLYAGFITFVLGSISIVPKLEKYFPTMFVFIFVLSSSLTLFIALLKLVFQSDTNSVPLQEIFFPVRGEDKKLRINKYTVFVWCSIFLFASSWLSLFYFVNKEDIIRKHIIREAIEEVNIYNQKAPIESEEAIGEINDKIPVFDSTSKTSFVDTPKVKSIK